MFDVETTGLSRGDEIIEIAAVELVDGKRTGLIFHSLIQPTVGIIISFIFIISRFESQRSLIPLVSLIHSMLMDNIVSFVSYSSCLSGIHPEASAVHGKTNADLQDAQPATVVLYNFIKWVADAPLAAHNAR